MKFALPLPVLLAASTLLVAASYSPSRAASPVPAAIAAPQDDNCSCAALMSLSNSKNCGIAVYWSGVSSPGVCGDGDCPDDAASKCSWGGTLTVVNNKTTPIAINISNAWGGWGGFCPNVPPGGECQRKVFPQAACGDGVQGYINITDWGPWGTDCQASLTFICDRCPASYHE